MADQEIEQVENEENFKNPLGVTTDEVGSDDVVVNVIFPGLKKKILRNEAANATVKVKFEARSFKLIVHQKKKTNKNESDAFRYAIKLLPDEIDPSACTYKIKEGRVTLCLRKVKARSWARELSEGGLETFEDEEEVEDEGQNGKPAA